MFLKKMNLNNFTLFLIILIAVSSIISIESISKVPHREGDGHEYYMMAESFLNHGTPEMTEEDIISVGYKSHLYKYKSSYIGGKNKSGYFKSLDGKYYS